MLLQGDAEEAMKLREKIISIREVWFKQNEEEISKRWAFEEGVCLNTVPINLKRIWCLIFLLNQNSIL